MEVTNQALEATKGGELIVKAARIGVGILIAAILLVTGAFLIWVGDQQAIQEAGKVAANAAYKVPALGIGAAGTSLMTLGAAWSAALVGVILAEK